MPRAVSRDEQAILLLVGRTGSSFPVPELAQRLGLTPEAAQRACEYLVSRGLLRPPSTRSRRQRTPGSESLIGVRHAPPRVP